MKYALTEMSSVENANGCPDSVSCRAGAAGSGVEVLRRGAFLAGVAGSLNGALSGSTSLGFSDFGADGFRAFRTRLGLVSPSAAAFDTTGSTLFVGITTDCLGSLAFG